MSEDFQHRLIKARSGHGWSQADLAEVSGVAAAQISRYEAGRSKPRTEVIAKLAKSLAVSFEWLAFGSGDIDDGSSVPNYPSSQVFFEQLEMDEEAQAAVLKLAKAYGLTYEMTIKQALLRAADELQTKGTIGGKKPEVGSVNKTRLKGDEGL